MSEIQKLDLKPLNTFGVEAEAENWKVVRDMSDLLDLAADDYRDLLVLGGGSNVLFTQKEVSQTILINKLEGIEVVDSSDESVVLRVMSGEVWDDLVRYTVQQNYGGLENLTLIPGTVGAAPMQNIGAYGVEVKDYIKSVEYWDFEEKAVKTLSADKCQFGYRTSIFKTELKSKVFIVAVHFKLNKIGHQVNTSYGAINTELENRGIKNPSIADISQVVEDIRTSKLPDPNEIGNAGSFFKNPIISRSEFQSFSDYKNIPNYDLGDDRVKIPAGWLIEQCDWKGYRDGDAGVYPKQALVLVNYGEASGKDIYELSQKIVDSVFSKFAIELEREVNMI